MPETNAKIPANPEGRVVSLNLTRRSFFKMPGSDFELMQARMTGRLPDKLSEWQKKMVKRALRFGELVIGDKPVTDVPKHIEALKPHFAMLNTPGISLQAIQDMINGIVRTPDQDPKIGGHTRFEAMEKLFAFEAGPKGQARRAVLEYITQAKEVVPGPTEVEDEPAPLMESGGSSSAHTALATEPDAADLDGI